MLFITAWSSAGKHDKRSRFRPELLQPPAIFYANELRNLSRPSRGWARTACPFHKGKNRTAFSVNLETGAFRCFNCGAHGGDVVAYVMARDHIDFRTACVSLGAWDSTIIIPDLQVLGRRQRQAEQARKQEVARQERITARDRVHSLDRTYFTHEQRLSDLRKGAARERFPGETEACWTILARTLPLIRDAEALYFTLAGVH